MPENRTSCILCGGVSARTAAGYEDRKFLECRRCGLIFAVPREVDAGIYDESYYVGRKLQAGGELADRNFNRWVLDVLAGAVPGGGRLLDIGCGTGLLLEMGRERGWEISGVELSPWAARRAADRLGVPVRVSRLEDVPFPGEPFDAVTAIEVVEHTPDPVVFLKNVREMVKPDGALVLSTPNAGSLFRTLQGKGWAHYKAGEHLQLFRTDSLKRLIRASGLRAVRFFYKHYYSAGHFLKMPSYVRSVEAGSGCGLLPGGSPIPAGAVRAAAKRFVVRYPGRYLSDNIVALCRRA
ncbi:MAG: class I SAM-dependent methyltransferase [bacterium]